MNMDINEIIESGRLESYCLGNLTIIETIEITELAKIHPEINMEIEKILEALKSYSGASETTSNLKSKVLEFLNPFLNEDLISLTNPPMINKYSNLISWSKALEHIIPKFNIQGTAFSRIYKDENRELNLVWLKNEIIEDAHSKEEYIESFLILEGSCECDFDGVIITFHAGDCFQIPPNTRHSIKNTSINQAYVKGLVQRIAA
ncbi:MAG: cupin domain-containing protein [Saprospiraceae bacterium]